MVCAWIIRIRGIISNRLSKVKQNLPPTPAKCKSRLIFREIFAILGMLEHIFDGLSERKSRESALPFSQDTRLLTALYRKLFLFDKLTLSVLIVLPLLQWFFGRLPAAGAAMLFGHAVIVIAVLALIHRQESLPAALRLLRYWYPILCLTFFFGEVGRVVSVLFPFWLEPYLIRSDVLLLHGWHGWEFFVPRLDAVKVEILACAYWGYFLLIPLVAWLHYRAPEGQNGKPRSLSFERVLGRMCVVMYTCYTLFLLLPARGPHHALNVHIDKLVSGGFFFKAVILIQKQSAVVGAAFPSSHVAAAWTLWLTLRKDFRTAFWLLFVPVALLTISTFILQYHYILDAVAGILLSFIIEGLMARHDRPVVVPAVRQPAQPAWQE